MTENLTTVTLNLPNQVYESFKRKADQSQRSVEDELLAVVIAQKPEPVNSETEVLPAELMKKLEAMELLDDETLWRAARPLSAKRATQLSKLNDKHQREGFLSPTEVGQQKELVREYERVMMVRAKALALLKQRGLDISELLKIKGR